jgi:hypothetical protein
MDVDVDTCVLDCCACSTEKEKYSAAATRHELPDGSGRFYLFRCRLLSCTTVKRRKALLLAASALVSASLGVSEPALAQTCTPAQPNVCAGIRIARRIGTSAGANLHTRAAEP